jgi:hypothetical protein
MAASVSLSSTVVASLNATRSGGFSTAVATGLRPHAQLAREGGGAVAAAPHPNGPAYRSSARPLFYPGPRYRTSGGRTSSRRAVRTARSRRRLSAIASVADENQRYRSSSSSTEPARLFARATCGGSGRTDQSLKRRRLLKEDMPCGRCRPPRAAALEIKFPSPPRAQRYFGVLLISSAARGSAAITRFQATS